MRTAIACLLMVCVAVSSLAAFPSKNNCCCKAFCAMKSMHCARSCSIGTTDSSKHVSETLIFSMAEKAMTNELAVSIVEASFETSPQQRLLSRRSPPEPPPPRA